MNSRMHFLSLQFDKDASQSSGGDRDSATLDPKQQKSTSTPILHNTKATQTPVHSNNTQKNDWNRDNDTYTQPFDWSNKANNISGIENISPNNNNQETSGTTMPIYKPSPVRYAQQYVDHNMAKPSFVTQPNTFEPVPNHPQFPVRLRGEDEDNSQDGRTLRSPRYYTNKYGYQRPEVKRQALPVHVGWDGQLSTFNRYKNELTGFYRQVGQGYMFDPEFQRIYKVWGDQAIDRYSKANITMTQFIKDKEALYGGVQSSIKAGHGLKQVLKYEEEQDGLMAWMELMDEYDKEGSKDLRIMKLESIVSTPFSRGYKGGMLQWVTDYESAFAELGYIHKVEAYTDDDMIKRRVLQYLQTPALSWLDNASKTMSSAELMQAIKEYAIKQNSYAKGRTISNVRHTVADAYAALTRIDPETWIKLPADVRKAIIDARRKELEEEKTKAKSKNNDEQTGTPLPKQYNKVAANMTIQEAEDALEQFTPEELAGMDDFIEQYYSHEDYEEYDSGVNVAVTITDHQAQLLHASEDDIYHPAIIDNGADTCVIGKGWDVLATHPTRKANVIGFDNEVAVKRHLPIVSAITAVDIGDDTYLIRVNEAVYNESAQHSLLSDYQLREKVPKLDCVSLRHGGRQEMTLSDEVKIPLNIKNCMVNFKHRVPTSEELGLIKEDQFNILELTQDAPWNPKKFTDEEKEYVDIEEEETETTHLGFHTTTQIYYDPTDVEVTKTTPGRYVEMNIEPGNEVIDLTISESEDSGEEEEDPKKEPEIIDLTNDSDDEEVSAYNVNLHQTFGLTPMAKEDDQFQWNIHRAVPAKLDYEKLAPHFGFRPKRIIQETLRKTTQLAKSVIRQPMRKHLVSIFQMLRRPRLNEIVATDTYFSPITSLEGYNCAQVFVGLSSRIMETRGMSTESGYISSLQDFIRHWGIPHTIRRDNAKSETSEKVQNLHRDLIIDDEYTEPHHPQQNPAEVGGVKYLKEHAEVLMNRTNSPENTWFLCHQYLTQLHNLCANPSINYQIPLQLARGDTPDISHLLLFYWFQPVLYLDPDVTFPETKERPGYFVGFAEASGDALTFKVLTEDLKTVLVRSVIRPANVTKNRNRRVTFKDDIEEILNKNEEVYQTERDLPPVNPRKLESRIKKMKEISEKKKKGNVASRTRAREFDNKDVAARTRNKQKEYFNRKVYKLDKHEPPKKKLKGGSVFLKDQVSLNIPGEVERPSQ